MKPSETRARTTLSNNLLLQSLSAPDMALIGAHLERCSVDPGDVLIDPAEAIQSVYFPESAIISVREPLNRDRHIEIGVIGREGMVGWPVLLGSERSLHFACVQMQGGRLLRIRVDRLRALCRKSPTLLMSLLRFVAVASVQMARLAVSHLSSPVELRLARWLLMRHDRMDGDEILIKHEDVSADLGVRRASVTEGLHVLEGDRLIRCNRGRIQMRDRAQLECRAGPTYGIPETHYRDMIAPFGKTDTATPSVDAPAAKIPVLSYDRISRIIPTLFTVPMLSS